MLNSLYEKAIAKRGFFHDIDSDTDVESQLEYNWFNRFIDENTDEKLHVYELSADYTITLKGDYIYKDAHLYLERKKDICYTPIDLRPTAFSIYGTCPDCGSVNIIRKGTRGKSQRLSCKDCNRQFSKLLNNADSDSNI